MYNAVKTKKTKIIHQILNERRAPREKEITALKLLQTTQTPLKVQL